MKTATRRTVLRGAGLASVLFLSGCNGTDSDGNGDGENGNGNGNGGGISGDDYPELDEWLTETDVGDADDTYDGTLVDRTDQESITIDVGAEGNDGFYAFAPSAVVVSTGTEIQWDWTGEGEAHNVEAEPDDQLGLSSYEFSSGEAVDTTGVQFTQTLDETGIALYHCEPHLALGMKGGIAVE
jgi:halocyanin-like protein